MTLEAKLNLCMEYITASNDARRAELKAIIKKALGVPTMRSKEEYTYQLLDELGVPKHLGGYYALADAINMVIEDRSYLKGITHELYAMIGENHNTSAECIRRSIDYAVQCVFYQGNVKVYELLFDGAERGKYGNVPPKKFIVACVDEVQRRMIARKD